MNKYKTIIIDPGHGGVDLGYDKGIYYEKDFNLDIGNYVYDKLNKLGYPVYITRQGDSTISNYDRFQYLNRITDENNGGCLVFSIQIDDEKVSDLYIIRSIKRDYETNKGLYDDLSKVGSVIVKTLPNDDKRDYYAIQRLAPDGSEAIVFEYGYDYLNSGYDKEKIGNQIVDVVIDYFTKVKPNNEYEEYVVNKGDTLYSLANKYNTSVEEIMDINNLGTDYLNIGQVIKLPKLKNNIYVVKKGDSLYSIAKKFDISVDQIKKINNLTSNKLLINQELIIPN